MKIRFQFGLKWFLVATTLVAVLVGTVGRWTYEQWRRDLALAKRAQSIRELEQFGAQLDRRGDGTIVRIHFRSRLCERKHFQLVSDIDGVESLDLANTGFSDADAPILAAHPNLRKLNVDGNTGFTDEGLNAVADLNFLEDLELSATGITDDGFDSIAQLPKLQRLWLHRTPVTSKGLARLRPLHSLRMLSIMFTNVEDQDLSPIGELRGLEVLLLDYTQVRGPGLAALGGLPKLERLHLRGCDLQDGSGLSQLRQITELSITDARVSPGVLAHIQDMSKLRTLYLEGSSLSDEQLAELAGAKQLTRVPLGKPALVRRQCGSLRLGCRQRRFEAVKGTLTAPHCRP